MKKMIANRQKLIKDIKAFYLKLDGFEPNHNFTNYSTSHLIKLANELKIGETV